jgi:hypothetical protein
MCIRNLKIRKRERLVFLFEAVGGGVLLLLSESHHGNIIVVVRAIVSALSRPHSRYSWSTFTRDGVDVRCRDTA